jgi:monoamine oxidase
LKKRRFLTLMALAALALLPPAVANDRPRRAKPQLRKRVVVVGAGISGLAAANELQARGHEVRVVEARDRIGGRIWTSTKWQDTPLDLGASWIHGVTGNPLSELADAIPARRIATGYERAAMYSTSGEPLAGKDEERLEELLSQVEQAIERARRQDHDLPLREAIEPITRGFARGSDSQRFLDFILNSVFEQEYAGSVTSLSAHWYDDDDAFGGEDALFVNGFGTVTDFLAKGLSIERGQVVREVRWGAGPVRILAEDAEFEADYALLTLPLGVLQTGAVKFTPELPRGRLDAIARLGMGVLNKCYLRFDEPFWPRDVDWLE